MEKYTILCMSVIALNIFIITFWNKLLKQPISLKRQRNCISITILCIGSVAISLLVPHWLRIIVNIILLLIINYSFYCKKISQSIIMVLYSDLIIFLSESILIFSISAFLQKDIYSFSKTVIGFSIINIGVGIISFVFLFLPITYKVFDYLLRTFDNMKKSNLIIYFIITILLICVFLIMTHMQLSPTILFFCDACLTIFYIAMLFKLANARENYKTVTSKYETSLSSLREYEEIMDRYRITNHENKNQLLTIRNMINKNDKKTIKYIDKIVDNKIKDNETIFYKTSKIPEGGLRAIIYSKLCKMKELNIDYELNIAKEIKTVELIELGDITVLNACKIIGVFLDNAIDEVNNLKYKKIIIEIYKLENNLYIDISNNYDTKKDVLQIGKQRYTTKGRNRGYGLSLVHELIKEDHNLDNEIIIDKEMFTQRLKIKI